MLKHLSYTLATLTLVAFTTLTGCGPRITSLVTATPTPTPTPGDPNSSTPTPTATPTPTPAAGLTIVKTDIPVRHDAGLECGDDLISFETGTPETVNTGISCIVPSTNPTAGTPVTDTGLYDSSDFAVGGRIDHQQRVRRVCLQDVHHARQFLHLPCRRMVSAVQHGKCFLHRSSRSEG